LSQVIDAGPFGEWLGAMRAVLRGERDADVPCGSCIGCCVSSYPIPLRTGDVVAREQVPEQWLLGATPPDGQWLMGFREDGSCPFMEAGRCTVYAHRPQTCRDYDCRIYAAAGLLPAGDRPLVHERVRAWHFRFESDDELREAEAVRRAAQFIASHAELFPAAMRAHSPTAAAVLAVKAYGLFMPAAGPLAEPAALAQLVIEAAQAF
jgi:Fe-S-cluster containining protein